MTLSSTKLRTVNRVEFDVDHVKLAARALAEVSYKDGVEALLQSPPPFFDEPPEFPESEPFQPIEACSRYHGKLVAGVHYHPVVAAIHLAYAEHRPLVLSPDMIWLMVSQGFANHVNAHSDELRSLLVTHAGQLALHVQRDDFCKGSPENPWAEVFAAFSGQIREHLGTETHDLLLPRFSTTGSAERAAAEVVLLDAVKSYFNYDVMTFCGIPRIGLEGTPDDWIMLRDRTAGLARYQLDWWTQSLAPILQEFVAASRGNARASFWQSIYKLDGGSGGPYISGWINAFFPYLKDWRTGCASRCNDQLSAVCLTTDVYPGGLSKAPFNWEYLEQRFAMEFLGGFVGVQQETGTLNLRPEIGWAVREAIVV